MSLQVRVKYSLLDAVLCALECGRASPLARSRNSTQACYEVPFIHHWVSSAEAGCQSEFVLCHLVCVPLGVEHTYREKR